MNRFLCLIRLFTAVYRVGGLETQALVYSDREGSSNLCGPAGRSVSGGARGKETDRCLEIGAGGTIGHGRHRTWKSHRPVSVTFWCETSDWSGNRIKMLTFLIPCEDPMGR